MLRQLLNDEAGFIVSAELVLIATILVLGMIVGLSQVQYAVVTELSDVAKAIGSLNQTYYYSGFHATKSQGGQTGLKSQTVGSVFKDNADACDDCNSFFACDAPGAECAAFAL